MIANMEVIATSFTKVLEALGPDPIQVAGLADLGRHGAQSRAHLP